MANRHGPQRYLLDNITLHGPQATIAVRAENLAYDVHDID